MSALRLGRLPDGTRDVRILEPSVGRITHTRYSIQGGGGGVLVVPSSAKPHSEDKRKGAHSPKVVPKVRGTCGQILRIIGEPCARAYGHKHDCKSRAALDAMAEGRRSGVGRWP